MGISSDWFEMEQNQIWFHYTPVKRKVVLGGKVTSCRVGPLCANVLSEYTVTSMRFYLIAFEYLPSPISTNQSQMFIFCVVSFMCHTHMNQPPTVSVCVCGECGGGSVYWQSGKNCLFVYALIWPPWRNTITSRVFEIRVCRCTNHIWTRV